MSCFENEANYQSSLVSTILSPSFTSPQPFQGMKLYQNNWLENAHRALTVSFPTVQKLLGEDNFRMISRLACERIAKTQYDWGEWGLNGQFVDVVRDFLQKQQVGSLNYVVECAQLDELIFLSQRANDPKQQAETFSILSSENAENSHLVLSPALHVEKFNYPVEKLYKFSHFDEGNITDLRSTLSEPNDVFVRISRAEFKPEIEQISRGEYALFCAAEDEKNIAFLFGKANELNIDFSQWLGDAIAKMLIVAVKQTD